MALEKICSAGVTLNKEKCLFGQNSLKFLGHVVNKNGISADPDKVTAIKQMEAPKKISALRRFLGMVNHLGKFSPKLATTTQPMRDLLSKRTNWCWGAEQAATFKATKDELLKSTVLHCMILKLRPRCHQMPHHSGLEQCYYNKMAGAGTQWHLRQGP